MNFSKRHQATAVSAAVIAVAAGGAGLAATDAGAHPAAKKPAVVIHAKVTKQTVKLDRDSVRAGRVTFEVTAPKGDHTLQVAQLHDGYTPDQLGPDADAGLEKGDLDAIQRLDTNVTWLGGVEVRRGKAGEFTVLLKKAGEYFIADQNGNGAAVLTVKGTAVKRQSAALDGTFAAVDGSRWDAPKSVQHNGWIRLKNTSDQPHFMVLNEVKKSTTKKDVKAYFSSGAEGEPAFGLKHYASSGVFSPGANVTFHLQHVPAGKYLLMCFWPDKETGMPHAAMGMWRLVTLK
ncbi:MAG TPA: hypothetical protein VHD58_10650 [Mycobacteriales bacterium]|nr:hypothetical protein [Mycobacteriales bacterium]